MLNRCILPSRCPPTTNPSLRPCLAFVPSPSKPRRHSTALITRERVSMRFYGQPERAASLRAQTGSATTLNEIKQAQRQCFIAGQSAPVSRSTSAAKLYRIPWRRRNRVLPTRPPIVLSRQRSRRTRAQSRLQDSLSLQVVKPGYRWCSGRKGGGDWSRRLSKIGKPSRSIGPHKTIKRTHWVSFGLWPKDTSWRSHQPIPDLFEKIHGDWTSNFQPLKIPEEMQTWTKLDTKQVIRYYWGLRSSLNYAKKEWMGLQGYDSERMWRNTMLWCLKYSRRQALMLLLATLKGRKYRPSRYAVSDCLDLLARHFLFKVSKPNPLALDAIWLLTCRFIDGASNQDQTFPVSQHLVHLVVKHSDDARVLSFYWLLGLNKALLHVNTMLIFLNKFLGMERINLSMNILGAIAKTNFDLSADRIQKTCVKLLRARFDTQMEYTARSNVLTQILQMGIRPKVHMFNAILLNAGEGGDFASAWQMYGLAQENALIPDSITYGVLLKGAILSGDLSNMEMVIREIQTHREVLQDLRLVSDVLNAISLVSQGDEFGSMLDFYKQCCDLRPLQELSLCGEETKAPPGANCHGVWPTRYILTRMILAYVRLHQGSLGLIRNYNLYYLHVQEKHPLIAPLAQADFVANSFIMAFGKNLGTLQHCTTVVRHMLEFSSPKFATFDSLPYTAPTVQTWSILVAAYFRNRQPRAAEKVLDMMRERGIRGNKVTWNTLVSGYAGLRDVSAAVDSVKQMEAAGFEADAYTTKGPGKKLMLERLTEALKTSVEELLVNKGATSMPVSPLNSEEQYEAAIGLEWGSTSLNRKEEVKEYLNAKNEDQLNREMELSSVVLAATA